MDNAESGDELGDTFLHTGHEGFLVQEDLDGQYPVQLFLSYKSY